MEIAGLVLAAGAGRRYGQPKALVTYRGRLLVRRAAETLTGAGCVPVRVVVGAEAQRVRAAAPELAFTDNPGWASGMASSLRAGLAALRDGPAAAVVVLLVDMPGVTPEAVRRITAGATPATLAMGGYGERRGHPVVLGRDHWTAVAATATGDHGARDYLRAHHDQVRVVPVGDVADDFDLDTPQDTARHSADPGGEDQGIGKPGSGNPESGNPGSRDPGNGDPGNGDLGRRDPGRRDPGRRDPGRRDPGRRDPERGDLR